MLNNIVRYCKISIKKYWFVVEILRILWDVRDIILYNMFLNEGDCTFFILTIFPETIPGYITGRYNCYTHNFTNLFIWKLCRYFNKLSRTIIKLKFVGQIWNNGYITLTILYLQIKLKNKCICKWTTAFLFSSNYIF